MSEFDKGTLVRCSVQFRNASNALADPTAVLFSFRAPGASSTTTYTYGTDAQLVKDSTGKYHVDLNGSTVGIWQTRFYSTGTGQAAAEATFSIRPSNL